MLWESSSFRKFCLFRQYWHLSTASVNRNQSAFPATLWPRILRSECLLKELWFLRLWTVCVCTISIRISRTDVLHFTVTCNTTKFSAWQSSERYIKSIYSISLTQMDVLKIRSWKSCKNINHTRSSQTQFKDANRRSKTSKADTFEF
jgi:hypothetical protein